MAENRHENEFTCPVCRAAQQPSETCRRCRCDLRLILRVEQAARDVRRRLLLDLSAHRWPEALGNARTLHALRADADSRRLLAVCSLLTGEFREAAQWANVAFRSAKAALLSRSERRVRL